MPAAADRDQFLKHLKDSGLIPQRDWRRVVEALPKTDRGRVAARALVELGVLTKFQAELLLVGKTSGFFLGQYKILDAIGQGGMGRVFKALHQTMNRTVALKVLTPQLVSTSKAQKLFKREVRAAAQLQHPHIVTAYDANQVHGRHYLVLEYVDGPNLHQLVQKQGPIPVPLACEMIRQAALGLQHAHERGMVHRDIKPANLLVQKPTPSQPFLVKILDFGLARLHERDGDGKKNTILNKDNTILGTPDFLSPEQSRNLNQVDIRSDLYSLGCTFYYLLTAEVPYPGGATLEKLYRHNTEPPVPLETYRQDVPDEVAAILDRMMAKKPEDRFQTPLAVAEALAPYSQTGSLRWRSRDPQDASEPHTPPPSSRNDAFGKTSPASDLPGTLPPNAALTPMSGDTSAFPWVDDLKSHFRWGMLLGMLGIGLGIGIGLTMWFSR